MGDVAELAAAEGVSLSRPAAERLQRHTLGLPLYVRTLLAELTPAQLTAPDGELSAPRSLASTTVARLADLPGEARALAFALAVLNTRTPLAAVAAVAGVERPAAALENLLSTGFVSWDPGDPATPVEFVHPLYRSAVYEDLSPTRRQALHRAAAAVLDPAAALPHRVAAADGTDDVLAEELWLAAERETRVGSEALAAHYLLMAAPLSSRPRVAHRRLLTAILLLLADGQPVRAGALHARAEACADSPLQLGVGPVALGARERGRC